MESDQIKCEPSSGGTVKNKGKMRKMSHNINRGRDREKKHPKAHEKVQNKYSVHSHLYKFHSKGRLKNTE